MIKNDKVRVAERRDEAYVRQTYYDNLTDEEKIAQCMTRRGNSKRELIRLNAWPSAA